MKARLLSGRDKHVALGRQEETQTVVMFKPLYKPTSAALSIDQTTRTLAREAQETQASNGSISVVLDAQQMVLLPSSKLRVDSLKTADK